LVERLVEAEVLREEEGNDSHVRFVGEIPGPEHVEDPRVKRITGAASVE
jgi:hypothetical protein